MEEHTEAPAVTPHGGVELQSMDDFMAESDARETEKEAVALTKKAEQPPAKKQKRGIDTEALMAEEEAVKTMGEVNWIGKLNEYRSVHPPASGLTYVETTVPGNPPRFTCAVEIRETPIRFNNNAIVTFGNKKTAKHYASKRAIDWLVGNGFMPKDGSIKFPKVVPVQIPKRAKIPPPQPKPRAKQDLPSHPAIPAKLSPVPSLPPKPVTAAITASVAATAESSSESKSDKPKLTSLVPDLCARLGFTPPSYEITKTVENAALWNGYASFGGDPRIDGPVGKVTAVYGQKNAKEAIAEGVVSFLKSIEQHRKEQLEADDLKRKRGDGDDDMDKSVHEDLETQAAKAAKPSERARATDSFL